MQENDKPSVIIFAVKESDQYTALNTFLVGDFVGDFPERMKREVDKVLPFLVMIRATSTW